MQKPIKWGNVTCLRSQQCLNLEVGSALSLSSQDPSSFCHNSTLLSGKGFADWAVDTQLKAGKHSDIFRGTHSVSENLKMKLKIKQQSQRQAFGSENVGPNLLLSACHVAWYLSLGSTAEWFEREEAIEAVLSFKSVLSSRDQKTGLMVKVSTFLLFG